MKQRQDLIPGDVRPGLEVFQLTEEEVPSSHIYMEAQIFTSDSKRFLLHRSATPHGSDKDDPEHAYLLCDIEAGCELIPLITETGATAPSISPCGRYVYYFIDRTYPGGGELILRRVGLDGTDRETLLVIDSPLPGTDFRPSRPYPLSTIAQDGRRLAISAFLGDGRTEKAPWGLIKIDLKRAAAELVISGPSWCNMHPQYTRSREPERTHEVLIQENHGCRTAADGAVEKSTGGTGAEIHVIDDDGENLRTMPWGRDGNEYCQGHQCWWGRSSRAITSTSTQEPEGCRLIEGRAAPFAGHIGRRTPGGFRSELSRNVHMPNFYHFATDIAGRLLITDTGPEDRGGGVYLAELPAVEGEPVEEFELLLYPQSSWHKDSHIHPFLSPDGSMGFFNSDESGVLQAYMVRGW